MAKCEFCKNVNVTLYDNYVLICFQCLEEHKSILSKCNFNAVDIDSLYRAAANFGFITLRDPINIKIIKDLALSIENGTIHIPVNRVEKNCKQCSRKNDLGVKTCWCCGVENPV